MMRTHLLAGVLVLFAPAVHEGALFAQVATPVTLPAGNPQTIEDVRKHYRIHAGPFFVNPEIQLNELGVDTNVFNAADQPASDFTFTLTPQAHVAVPIARRALVTAPVGAGLVYYAEHSSERSVDPQAAVRAEAYMSRMVFFAEGSYVNTRQRPNYEIDVRSRHLDKALIAGVTVRVTPKFWVEPAIRRGKTRFDGDAYFEGQRLKETLDQDSDAVTLTLRQKLSALTTVILRAEKQRDRFPLSPVRDTDSYRVMPGVELRPRALVSGRASIGYRSFTPKSPLLSPQSGLVSELGLTYTVHAATTFGVTYDRDYDFAYEVLTPYFVDNSVGIFVRRAVGGRFDVIVNAARHRYAYQPLAIATAGVDSVADRLDTTDNYGANLGYRLKRETRVGFGFAYWTRNSTTLALREYHGLRAGTTVTHAF